MIDVRVPIPKKLLRLRKPARIKVAFGGRGGGKTESIGRLLAGMGAEKPTRMLLLREKMNSIEDSVHSVMCKSIAEMQLDGYYRPLKTSIEGSNGSKMFYGQLGTNLSSTKSKDEVNICWVEEAEDVSEEAIDVLEPSIRADNSEIWYSFNPGDPDAYVYKTYVEPYLDEIEKNGYYESEDDGGLIVVKINLDDNPLAPKVLHDQSAKMKRTDYQKWLNIWGGYAQLLDVDNNLIKADRVVHATKTNLEKRGPLIVGVDPARFGKDKTAIIRRQGRVAYGLAKFSNQCTMTIAGRIAILIKMEEPDMVFIDIGGLGAGIYDRLIELGYGYCVKAVNFGGKAMMPDRYHNKRSEMWGDMNDWLGEAPVSIPDDPVLIKDLISPQYKIRSNGTLLLESKDDMKKRKVKSTDSGDALGLTFAFPVAHREIREKLEAEGFEYHQPGSSSGY